MFMINRNRTKILNDHKILHKKGKKWITVSTILLGATGVGALATINANAANIHNTAKNQPHVEVDFNKVQKNQFASSASSSPMPSSASSDISSSAASVSTAPSLAPSDTMSRGSLYTAPSVGTIKRQVESYTAHEQAAKMATASAPQMTEQPYVGDDDTGQEKQIAQGIANTAQHYVNYDANEANAYIRMHGLNINSSQIRSQPLQEDPQLNNIAEEYTTKLVEGEVPSVTTLKKAASQLGYTLQYPVHINKFYVYKNNQGQYIARDPANPEPLTSTDNSNDIAQNVNSEFMDYDTGLSWSWRYHILDPNDIDMGVGVKPTSQGNYIVTELFSHKKESPQERRDIMNASINTLDPKTYSWATRTKVDHFKSDAYTAALHNGEDQADASSTAASKANSYSSAMAPQASIQSLWTPQYSSAVNQFYNSYIAPDTNNITDWANVSKNIYTSLASHPGASATAQDKQKTFTMTGNYAQQATAETFNDINEVRAQYHEKPVKPSLELQTIANQRMINAFKIYDYYNPIYGWRSVHKDSQGTSYIFDISRALNMSKLYYDPQINMSLYGEIAGEGHLGKHRTQDPGYNTPVFDVENGKDMADSTIAGMTKYDQSQGNGHLKDITDPEHTYVGIAYCYVPNLRAYVMVADFGDNSQPDPDLSTTDDTNNGFPILNIPNRPSNPSNNNNTPNNQNPSNPSGPSNPLNPSNNNGNGNNDNGGNSAQGNNSSSNNPGSPSGNNNHMSGSNNNGDNSGHNGDQHNGNNTDGGGDGSPNNAPDNSNHTDNNQSNGNDNNQNHGNENNQSHGNNDSNNVTPGGHNGSPANDPNNGNDANNGKANNSNPNNDDPNNVIVPIYHHGGSNNNNNITPNGDVINNNDDDGFDKNAWLKAEKDDDSLASDLSNTEAKADQDALNMMNADYQSHSAQAASAAREEASNSTKAVSIAAQNATSSQAQSLSDSAELQSLTNIINYNKQQMSSASNAESAKSSYMVSLDDDHAYANSIAQDALDSLDTAADLTPAQHQQMTDNIKSNEDNYLSSINHNGKSANSNAQQKLMTQVQAVGQSAVSENATDEARSRVDAASSYSNDISAGLADLHNDIYQFGGVTAAQRTSASNEADLDTAETSTAANFDKSNPSALSNDYSQFANESSEIMFNLHADSTIDSTEIHDMSLSNALSSAEADLNRHASDPTNAGSMPSNNVSVPSSIEDNSNDQSSSSDTDPVMTGWDSFMNNLNSQINSQDANAADTADDNGNGESRLSSDDYKNNNDISGNSMINSLAYGMPSYNNMLMNYNMLPNYHNGYGSYNNYLGSVSLANDHLPDPYMTMPNPNIMPMNPMNMIF